jgi:hypothetical protein
MVKIIEAIKRPFSDLKLLATGLVIAIISVILATYVHSLLGFVINLLIYGYGLKCAETILHKKGYKLPAWKNWGDLFVKGITQIVIAIIYLIPAGIILFLAMGKAIMSGVLSFSNSEMFAQNMASMMAGAGSLVILAAIVLLVTVFLLPLGMMSYVKTWKFGDAFKFKEIFKKITGTYIGLWVLAIIYAVILSFIFAFVPIIGGGIALFLTVVTTYTWFAEGYMSK